MQENTKRKMASFGTLVLAAVLGAAMWEGLGHLVKPAIAQENSNYPDPRNVTAMRMEQLKATAETTQSLNEILKFLQSGDMKVKADILSMPEEDAGGNTGNGTGNSQKTKKKKTSAGGGTTSEIEIIRD